MKHQAKSIRPFVGAKHYELSRRFYNHLNFEESIITPNMSLFKIGQLGFYLQNAYIKDWIDNTMLFVEVENVRLYWEELSAMNLPDKYPGVKVSPIKVESWGRECFLHDPSGVLWHFGEFNKQENRN